MRHHCCRYFVSTFTLMVLVMHNGQADAQMIVAHRGASYDAPENTIAAFQLAWEQQADGIEGDFYLTREGRIICIHDADTERTGGKRLVVSESSLEELQQLEYGSWKGAEFRGEPLPTFADVLAVVPSGKKFIVELKTGPEIIPFLKAELERMAADRDSLLIISFNKHTVAACREQLPTVRAHWLTGYKQDKTTGIWSPSREEVARDLRESKADGLGTQGNRRVVNEQFIAYLKEQGLQEFHVWTIDDPDDARYFQQLGAMGITTNRPALIRQQLNAAP